jgi:hypothetical protein
MMMVNLDAERILERALERVSEGCDVKSHFRAALQESSA